MSLSVGDFDEAQMHGPSLVRGRGGGLEGSWEWEIGVLLQRLGRGS